MIQYVKGDATDPVGYGYKILVHCCNDIGAWGAGFVLAVSKKWPNVKKEYDDLAYLHKYQKGTNCGTIDLGMVQFVLAEHNKSHNLQVANLIGQRGVAVPVMGRRPPICYDAIDIGLEKVAKEAERIFATVHMPRMGCGLAGGDWRVIEALIHKNLTDNDIPVFVYDPKEV